MNKQYLDLIKANLPNKIYDNISNVELFYKGFHNYTFKAQYKKRDVQLRIPLNKVNVKHNIENIILENFASTIYYKNGVLIRKWFDGQTLEKVSINDQIQTNILNKVKTIHQIQIDLPELDLFYYGKGTKKYQKLVNKYLDSSKYKTSHLDLNLKNILVNDKNEVEIIDFEWSRKTHPGFDALSLIKNVGLNKDIVCKHLDITKEVYEDFYFITSEFQKMGYRKTYSKFVIDEDTKQLTSGYTNQSFVKNDLFIQVKKKNGFNHLTKLEKFNKLSCVIPVIFEDEKLIIRKFINNNEIDFSQLTNKNKIVKAIKELHLSKIKVPNNKIYDRLKLYLEICPNKEFLNRIGKDLINKILVNSKTLKNEVVSHNDPNTQNIILTNNQEIKLIDFEYVSMNSKYFDLAYIASEHDLNDEEEKQFLTIYSNNIDFNEYYRVKVICNFYGILWSLSYNPDFEFNWLEKNIYKYKKYLN
ncbi:phosphotransferase [Mycoplasma sp. Mirounga ES2805-ORL]|uniref:phosphotransferase n=1 Tax=Mycoplasma sp. Mirounga ES2805-ORL TaxID=754514 RepID=UPI00197B92BC|nr:phosphotransferase [Mycoplasma sp. Mirounga ES2805-ORL]QSF13812.1 phosphotransferase [Mycoplasma sp. Mirounga ES2805-ORL]